jgi:hypothetical protein
MGPKRKKNPTSIQLYQFVNNPFLKCPFACLALNKVYLQQKESSSCKHPSSCLHCVFPNHNFFFKNTNICKLPSCLNCFVCKKKFPSKTIHQNTTFDPILKSCKHLVLHVFVSFHFFQLKEVKVASFLHVFTKVVSITC